jgi:hypothetical protein
MYQIHVVVFGTSAALDRIERVTYYLYESYPNPVRTSIDRKRVFELKELAYKYSVIRVDICIKGQVELICLS